MRPHQHNPPPTHTLAAGPSPVLRPGTKGVLDTALHPDHSGHAEGMTRHRRRRRLSLGHASIRATVAQWGSPSWLTPWKGPASRAGRGHARPKYRAGTYPLVPGQDTRAGRGQCVQGQELLRLPVWGWGHTGRVIPEVHVGQGDVPAECLGQETEPGCPRVHKPASRGLPAPAGTQSHAHGTASSGAPDAHSLGCRHGSGPHLQTGWCVPQQSPHPCRQPRPLLTALPQECMTGGDCVIQETVHVFLGACSGNVARTAVHTAVRILGRQPKCQAAWDSHVLSPEGLAPGRPPPPHLPERAGGTISRAGSWGGEFAGSKGQLPLTQAWALLAKHCL